MTPGADTAMREVAHEFRDLTRKEAKEASPPIERFYVRRVKPLRLEAFRSDLMLDEDDDDLHLSRGVRKTLKKGDVVYVALERDGDYVILGASSATGSAKEEPEDDANDSLKASGIGMIEHGADGSKPRGTKFAHYVWVGSAEPENAIENDQWIKPE